MDDSPRDSVLRGAGFMLLASLGFAVMGALVKQAAILGVPPVEIVVWRSGITAVCIGLWAWRDGVSLRPVNPRMHLVRGLVGVGSMGFYFTAISRLPLGDAVLLTYLSPLLVAAMSPWVTGESATGRVWAALGTGLAGVALVAAPAGASDPIGVGFALLAAFFAADAYLAIRVLTRTDHPLTIVFWFSVIGTAAGSVAFLDGVAPLGWPQVAALVSIGLLGTLAQWALTRAYGSAPAAQVSVYSYATPVLAYGAGLVALGEVPRWSSLAGAAVVVVAGMMAAR
jgi:drug/metabolite transporter (DMT)-like permease